VKIDTDTFGAPGINAYHTASEFRPYQIPVPEDDEVVLEYRAGHEFPKAIIADVLKLER
jgi:hypothetical protein